MGAIGEVLYGIPNEHPRTKDWWEEASYTYEATPHITITGKEASITFTFPYAAGGPVEFTTWLYRYNRLGKRKAKNMVAEMLQCYIDRDPIL